MVNGVYAYICEGVREREKAIERYIKIKSYKFPTLAKTCYMSMISVQDSKVKLVA